jgi:hypothetical protein
LRPSLDGNPSAERDGKAEIEGNGFEAVALEPAPLSSRF